MARMARLTALAALAASTVLGGASAASAHGGEQAGAGGSWAHGKTAGSPGVLSGFLIQAPIHVPVGVCGNTIDVVGLLNPSFGNTCVETGHVHHHKQHHGGHHA